MNKQTDGPTERWAEIWTNKQWAERWTNRQVGRKMNKQADRQKDGQTGRWAERRMTFIH